MNSEFPENSQAKSKWRLLLLIPIFIVIIVLAIFNSNKYGRKTQKEHLTLFNTSSIPDSLANNFLKFFNKTYKYDYDISIQLDFEDGRYKVKAPVTLPESMLNDYMNTQEFPIMARLISDSVFNSKLTDFVATDKHFKPIKTFPMDITIIIDSLNRLHKNDKFIKFY
jgi:hypothetical protein